MKGSSGRRVKRKTTRTPSVALRNAAVIVERTRNPDTVGCWALEHKPQAVIPAAQPIVQANAATLLSVIERAARDQAVDIDKMERLMAMHERMVTQDAEKAFNEAMTACQAEMKQVAADANNPQTRSKYASYAKLDSVLRPVYTKHGFALSFDEGDSSKPEHVRVICYVSHVRGHTRTYHRDMPADGKGAKGGDVMTKTHAAGAAGSYGARYLLKGIFNVAVGEYDMDGNASGEYDAETAKANLEAAAKQGLAALHKAWADLPMPAKVGLKDLKEKLKHQAADVDAAK